METEKLVRVCYFHSKKTFVTLPSLIITFNSHDIYLSLWLKSWRKKSRGRPGKRKRKGNKQHRQSNQEKNGLKTGRQQDFLRKVLCVSFSFALILVSQTLMMTIMAISCPEGLASWLWWWLWKNREKCVKYFSSQSCCCCSFFSFSFSFHPNLTHRHDMTWHESNEDDDDQEKDDEGRRTLHLRSWHERNKMMCFLVESDGIK